MFEYSESYENAYFMGMAVAKMSFNCSIVGLVCTDYNKLIISGMHANLVQSKIEMTRLLDAKVNPEVMDKAIGAYILSVIANHGPLAQRLCNKDPLTLRQMHR